MTNALVIVLSLIVLISITSVRGQGCYGRWSLNHLTFQLRSILFSELKIIIDEYTMKNNQTEKIAFQADSQWILTLPVDGNQQPGIYDKIQFNYARFNYTYYFGYDSYPHCPRC
ncbi:unnamed protein product [Rotaria sordida]|uniref:Uncharacterized protein n=1 Tax=Rotaria sordida TaxID=392033 RepID=A0A819CUK9_9BILA|nr:unnamed protein product [Rotaria sordida]